ncbi:MAG: hypothetical protein QXQ57_07680 [Sulfolobales archaeon]
MVTMLMGIIFITILLLPLCTSVEGLIDLKTLGDLRVSERNNIPLFWEFRIVSRDHEYYVNEDQLLMRQLEFGTVSGDQVVYIPIYDKSNAAPGENITIGVIAISSAGPIPQKSLNYTIYSEGCLNIYKSYSLITNKDGVAFFNLSSASPNIFCLRETYERIFITNIAASGLTPSISNGTLKVALVNMSTGRGYTGSLPLGLIVSRANLSNGQWEPPRTTTISVDFLNGEAIIDLRNTIAQLYSSLDTNYVYKVEIISIGGESIYLPFFTSLIVLDQNALSRVARVTYITYTRSFVVPNISSPGSIAIVIHDPLYRLLSGTLITKIQIMDSSYNVIVSKTANINVTYGSAIVDLSSLIDSLPQNATFIYITPVAFIDSGGNPLVLLEPADNISIVKRSFILGVQPEGLVISPTVRYYGDIVQFTVYYNGSPLPNVDVKLYLPDPSAPVLSGKTDANGIVAFNITQAYPKIRSLSYTYKGFFTYAAIATYGNSTAYLVARLGYPSPYYMAQILEDQVPRLNITVTYSPVDMLVVAAYSSGLPVLHEVKTDLAVISNGSRLLDLSTPYGTPSFRNIGVCTMPSIISYGCPVQLKINRAPNFVDRYISNSTVVGQSIDLTYRLASTLNISGSYTILGTTIYINDLLGDYRIDVYNSTVSNGAAVRIQTPFNIISPFIGFISSLLILRDNNYIYDAIDIYVDVRPSIRASFSLRADRIFDTVLVNEYINYTVFITNNANFTDYYIISVNGPGSVDVTFINVSAGSTAAINLRIGGFTSPGIFITNLTVVSQLTGSSLYLVFSTTSIAPVSSISQTIIGSGSVSLDNRINVSVNAISPVNITVSRLNTTGIPTKIGIPSGGIADLLFDVRVSNVSALIYPIWINISYASISFSGSEQNMKLYRYNFSSAKWEPFRETGVDVNRKIVWAKAYPDELSGVLINPVPGPLLGPPPSIVGGELEIDRYSYNKDVILGISVLAVSILAIGIITVLYIYHIKRRDLE